MIIIAHRGILINGDKENNISVCQNTLSFGFDIEIDVWYAGEGKFYLGHDTPNKFMVLPSRWLRNKHVWIHAKTPRTLYELLKRKAHCFYIDDLHQCVLTSRNYIWTSPKGKLTPLSIAVMPELSNWTDLELQSVTGICTDSPIQYKELLYDFIT